MKKYLNKRMWVLIFVLFLSLLAIRPNPFVSGIVIKSVGIEEEKYLKVGYKIIEFNQKPVSRIEEFNEILMSYRNPEQEVSITTNKATYTYNITNSIGFKLGPNLTILEVEDFFPGQKNEQVQAINNIEVSNISEFEDLLNELVPLKKVSIKTDNKEVTYLIRGVPDIVVENAKPSNINFGLEITGGIRALIEPKSETPLTEKDISDLINVMSNRFNVYGLSDTRIRAANDWEGNRFVLIEISGISKAEMEELVGKQGKFEAKIGDNVVFEGGKKDIPYVCRDDGSCSGIRQCQQLAGQWYCEFYFEIRLSNEAAQKHAVATSGLDVVTSESGRRILNNTLDLYLDGKLVDTLQIGADLKGSETTSIAISGPGYGSGKQEAISSALNSMDKLQTVLITGSLPYDIEIAKIDTISPSVGGRFIKDIVIAGLIGAFAVIVVIFIRYRNFKVLLPMLFTMLSEVVIILGFAAFIKWNIDLPSVVGIIASIGTGVDDQIVIVDEALRGRIVSLSWKQKLKRAFFIIFAAYATTVVAMIPLWNAGAGLYRGLAITTIVGVSVGVFLTRPVFASIIEKMQLSS